jgi:GNAT superfamily N-acetyltransferase
VSGGLTVRKATTRDATAILEVNATGWRHGYRGIVAADRLANLPFQRWRDEITNGLRRPVGDAFTRVGEIDGRFAGYCYVAAPARDADLGRVAELVALYVDPGTWRRGVGSALLEAAEAEAAARGYAQLSLWTFAENERARSFYQRHGWAPDGSEKLHPFANANAIRLQKRVGSERPGAEARHNKRR